MSLDLFPLMPGDISNSVSLDQHLGKLRFIEDLLSRTAMLGGLSVTAVKGTSVLRLAKCSVGFNVAPGACVIYASSALNTVAALAGAAADKATVAGFALLPPATTALVAGYYFWVVCSGPAPVLANANYGAMTELSVRGTAGGIDDNTVTVPTTVAWSYAANAGGAIATAARAVLLG